ncbi:MAG: hypothetical protein KBS76_05030, partial [Ruminococcus sp.]|nr:hypothetical protein [Candidatus Apopatosoma intestinale]
MKNNQNVSKEERKLEDVSTYRMLVLVMVAIIGFALIGVLNANMTRLEGWFFVDSLPFISVKGFMLAIAGVLAVLSIGYYIYRHFAKKTDETASVITSFGIMSFFLVLFVGLFFFRFFSSPATKMEIFFLIAIVLSFFYTLCSRKFFFESLFAALCGVTITYVGSSVSFHGIESIFRIGVEIVGFAAAALALITFTVLLAKKKIVLGKKTVLKLSTFTKLDC